MSSLHGRLEGYTKFTDLQFIIAGNLKPLGLAGMKMSTLTTTRQDFIATPENYERHTKVFSRLVKVQTDRGGR